MTDKSIIDRLQPHTVLIYNLASHDCAIRKVKARSLLTFNRFDLFAKLFYIDKSENGQVEFARNVYKEHILAFNPDCKEPGREDKNSVEDFICAFDILINRFRTNEFDDGISLIPVSEDGTILDGAHRVAALAYFDKDVTIAQFSSVSPKCSFNYQYFLNRGLSWATADTIANTMVQWLSNIYVACLWPKMGPEKKKQDAILYISQHYPVVYEKRMLLSLRSLTAFITQIYKSQSWVNNSDSVRYKALECFDQNREVHFVFFKGNDLESVLADKVAIRDIYMCGKHALHITDNDVETRDVADMILTGTGLTHWYESSVGISINAKLRERLYYFKKVQWVNIKVLVAHVIHFIKK